MLQVASLEEGNQKGWEGWLPQALGREVSSPAYLGPRGQWRPKKHREGPGGKPLACVSNLTRAALNSVGSQLCVFPH